MDIAVVGSGPNGLAAAVIMARAGARVSVFEAQDTLGGGVRSADILGAGVKSDVCSAVYPMVHSTPFFSQFQMSERVNFVTPEVSYAHPLDSGQAALAFRDLDRTVAGLGRDGKLYKKLLAPLVDSSIPILEYLLGSFARMPRKPLSMVPFGLGTLWQSGRWWNAGFREERVPAVLSGVFGHNINVMPSVASTGAGLVLAMLAHGAGWPIPVGGAQALSDALVADLERHGGTVHPGVRITSLRELPANSTVFVDTSLQGFGEMAGDALPVAYRRRIDRFHYGNAVCKVDFLLSEPVPWAHPGIQASGTVHCVGTRSEAAQAARAVANGHMPSSPYVLVSQPSLFDSSRAPAGQHVLWTYTHVPRGSGEDRTEAVIRQIERFAPGFRDVIVNSVATTGAQMPLHNANYVGGDIFAGAMTTRQALARPWLSREPWRTPLDGVYMCSASVAPGPGVHGMGGYHAAATALRDFGMPFPDLSLAD